MKRSSPIKRTPLQPSQQPLKRTRLKPISDHRKEVNVERSRLLEERFGPRSRWKCYLRWEFPPAITGECYGDISDHEILKRSRAGSTDANLLNMDGIVLLCAAHQLWVEMEPEMAHRIGLANHWWET